MNDDESPQKLQSNKVTDINEQFASFGGSALKSNTSNVVDGHGWGEPTGPEEEKPHK